MTPAVADILALIRWYTCSSAQSASSSLASSLIVLVVAAGVQPHPRHRCYPRAQCWLRQHLPSFLAFGSLFGIGMDASTALEHLVGLGSRFLQESNAVRYHTPPPSDAEVHVIHCIFRAVHEGFSFPE
ncbi:hypothetical protein C8F01DRAFT_1252444 [Mycena amicta]|nr:hypothetical protein C8F01DRAFT_1271061 [Mycena amicta]KAJ7048117.1 hypothetical protein C8F01DRAFT_1268630 [Mycena amicta]KAJ7050029.1 hypothetical protein C8F01DRAFT_1264590 [Mycena amicta]KAJ7052338.1 hypothetical protein C8F01DRAFT_1261780 [Mycena amicta]KAJ7053941.1 hypothetical protein C8F01DRAFT_1260164 [Mycena amicta]